MALKVLAADVNLGYHDWSNWIIDSFNGKKIQNFQQFTQLLHTDTGTHVDFADKSGYRLVIDSAKARQSEDDILQLYRIPSSTSPGLFDPKE